MLPFPIISGNLGEIFCQRPLCSVSCETKIMVALLKPRVIECRSYRFAIVRIGFLNEGAVLQTTFLKRAALMTLVVASVSSLGGCGAGSVTPTTPVDTSTTPQTVQLLVSTSQMPSAGNTPVDVTAVVLSPSGQTIAGKAVIFSTGGDSSAYFSANSGISDSNGVVTAKLNLGSNKSIRNINISGTAGVAVGSNVVGVTGTSLAISGNNSLALGASTTLTINVKDSGGAAMPGVSVSVSSQNGNTIALSPSNGITDTAGQITATITATSATAADVITASSSGAVKTQNLTISSSTFTFTTPTANVDLPINTATTISLTWSNAGVPVSASSVSFSASRGTITGPAATTNGSGVATASITSPTAGSTIIAAAGPGGTPATSVTVNFITNSASFIAPQANPGTIQVTTGATGQSSNSSVISVVVRDKANNLVKNAQVNFSIASDTSGGSLSSSTATTDSFGSASVNFIAGANSTAQDGVIIDATVISVKDANGAVSACAPIPPATTTTTCPDGIPTGQAKLTVSGQALMVRLGTDNLVGSYPPSNRKTFVAIVTDAGGNAVPGANVYFKLRPIWFYKGYFTAVIVAGGTSTGSINKWVQTIRASCVNEDNGNLASGLNYNSLLPSDATLAYNGIVDYKNINIGTVAVPNIQNGEDFNGNGSLEPGGVATITSPGITDLYGNAIAYITYPKDHSMWAKYIVEARTSLNSNDPPTTAEFTLDGLASDYTDLKVEPPGLISPYGDGYDDYTSAWTDSCADTY